MKNKKIFYAIIIFIGICIVSFIFVLTNLIKVNSRCVESPFTFAANTIVDNKKDQINALCSCEFPEGKFYFDKEGMYNENPSLRILR